jgi:hypothetical protein
MLSVEMSMISFELYYLRIIYNLLVKEEENHSPQAISRSTLLEDHGLVIKD